MSFITSIAWVKRGVASEYPNKVQLTESDLQNFKTELQSKSAGDIAELSPDHSEPESDACSSSNSEGNNAKEDIRDDQSDTESNESLNLQEASDAWSVAKAAKFLRSEDDPYVGSHNDSDNEEDRILPSENLILVGKTKVDVSSLEVYVYHEQETNCWCHHDIFLENMPIVMEWIGYDIATGNNGNFVAVGTNEPHIEIWDVDIMEAAEPAFTLQGQTKKKKKGHDRIGHRDAVLSLSWNRHHAHVLASGSADKLIGLWDLEDGKLTSTFKHDDKVQSVQWHPTNATILLSGSADHTVCMWDCRTLDPSTTTWTIPCEVENVLWNTHKPDQFLVGTETGFVHLYDIRSTKPLFRLQAHTSEVTGMSLSSSVEGCLLTTSTDKTVKVWDIRSQPKSVLTRALDGEQLFCCSPCPDSGLVFAIGGQKQFRVLNLNKIDKVTGHFNINTDKNLANKVRKNESGFEGIGFENDMGKDSDVSEEEISSKISKAKKEKKKVTKSHLKTGHKPNVTNDVESVNTSASSSIPMGERVHDKKNKKKIKKRLLKNSEGGEVFASAKKKKKLSSDITDIFSTKTEYSGIRKIKKKIKKSVN